MRKILQIALFIAFISTGKLFAQPCDFTYTEFPVGASHCAGITLIFSDASVGATDWFWDFGPGAIPQFHSQQNPGIVNFPTCNINQQVTLTINGGACTHTETVPIYCNPVACFTISPDTACALTPINFNSNCSQVGGGSSSLSYDWDVCDGSHITSANFIHNYPALGGCFCATLIVTNDRGCKDDTTKNPAVCFTPPPSFQITAIGPTATCQQSLSVDFCATPVVNGSQPYSFAWSFPGGSPSSSILPCPLSIDFTTGSYSVSCVVTDASGCSTSHTISNMINVGNNSTSIIVNEDTVCVGESIAVSTGPGSGYLWTINPSAGVSVSPNNASQSISYSFLNAGTYIITLNDSVNGCAVSAVDTVYVFDKPVACINLTSNAPACSVPQTVNVAFCGVANPSWTYSWVFTGGTPATSLLQNPGNIVYNTCGHFTITLTVSGLGGCDSMIILNDTVVIDCPIACYEIDNLPLEGKFCAPLTLDFNASCSVGFPTQYLWCIQPIGMPPCIPTNNLGPTPTLSFDSAGCYNVYLKINDPNTGCNATVLNSFTFAPICVGEHTIPCFTADPETTCAPLPVLFENCTVDTCGVPGGICWKPCQAWCWNFGDGTGCQSFLMEPIHLYQDTGCFDIMLVSKNCGCYDTLIMEDYICIEPPIPSFTWTVDCSNPNVVHFDASNSVGADSIIQWTFTGGIPSTSNSLIVDVTYPMPNPSSVHTASIKICNAASTCCDSTGQFIVLFALQAIASIDTIICYPETSTVTNISIGASNYVWTGYDLCNNLAPVPALYSTSPIWFPGVGEISFPGPGKYRMRLRAIANACEDTLEWDVTVRGLQPLFYGDNLNGCAPLTVTFTDTTQSNCVSIPMQYSWDFGDSTPQTTFTANPIISHTYTNNGSYTVTEYVKDQFGCISSVSYVSYVNVQVPQVDFNVADTTICLGTQICFNNLSTGLNLNFVWDFGDNTTSLLSAPCHIYLSSGTYTVELTATDINGCINNLIKVNYIIVGEVDVDFSADSTFIECPPLEVNFSINPSIPLGCESYYWSFGDGSHSTLPNPYHIYAYAGSFTVSLIATDLCLGCTDTVVKVNYIYVGGPFSNPTATPDTACLPQLIIFDLNPTNAASFFWDFDDGTPLFSGSSAIAHSYAMPDTGIFYPSVVLTDSSGQCSYVRIVDTLVLVQPIAKFYSSTNDLCSNGTVTFTDNSWSFGGIDNLGQPINHIVNWLWDFGGFGTSTLQNPPPVLFTTFGDFYVSLTITSVGGCTDIFYDTIHVTEAPTAIPVAPITGLCFGDSVNFIADTTNSSTVCSQLWSFGDGTTSTLLNPAHLYLNTGPYTVTLILYGCNGCNDTATTTISISPNPVANAGPDATICNDSTSLLIGSGVNGAGSGYQWVDTIPATLSTLINDSTFASPFANTTYTLIVTDGFGCKDTDAVAVFITPPPVASITPGDSICPGSSFSLTASGGNSYLWSTGETTATITFTPDADDTTYILTVTAFVGSCGDDTTASIVVLPFPFVDAGDSAEFCFGLSTQLNGTSTPGNYLWSPAETLSDSSILNPIANPTVTTTYILTVMDSIGCQNHDSVIITVHPLPIIDAGPDKKICDETYTQLNATGAITYSWLPTIGLLNSTIANPICGGVNIDTTTYTVTGTDAFGCQGNDSLTVFVLFPFSVTYPNDTCFCKGESASLCAISSTQSFYNWKPITGLDSSTTACVTATPSSDITYIIYVSDELGCYADTGDVTICLYPLPTVISSPDETILVGTTAQLTAYNVYQPGTGAYHWLPDSTLTCYGCENPIANPLQTTIYIVTLVDLNGCKDEDTSVITVYCDDNVLFVPNAFTPNNDGLNDEFHLDGVGITELHFIKIYNRWGQKVYESNNFNGKWDGRINGKKSEPEVFDYFLEAVCSTGQLIRKQGNITLIR